MCLTYFFIFTFICHTQCVQESLTLGKAVTLNVLKIYLKPISENGLYLCYRSIERNYETAIKEFVDVVFGIATEVANGPKKYLKIQKQLDHIVNTTALYPPTLWTFINAKEYQEALYYMNEIEYDLDFYDHKVLQEMQCYKPPNADIIRIQAADGYKLARKKFLNEIKGIIFSLELCLLSEWFSKLKLCNKN